MATGSKRPHGMRPSQSSGALPLTASRELFDACRNGDINKVTAFLPILSY